MKILFLFNGIYPEGMAMSNRLHLYAKGLLANGVQVDVVIPSNKRSNTSGFYEGIKFSTIKNPIIFQNYFLRQINSVFASFYYAEYCFRKAKNYDVFLIPGFGWFSALLMILCTHIGGARLVMEVNENPYSPEGGRLDPVWIRKIRRQLMLYLPFQFTDGFIVISESLEKLIQKHKRRFAKIIKIPILIDNKSELLTASKDLKHPFIFHTGGLSETKDGVIAMFEAFSKACKKLTVPLRFILTTKVMQPGLLQKIESIINTNGLKDRVIFKGLLSKKELNDLRNSCTLAIINKPSNWQNDYNFPTKLGELMLAGIPVIASSTGEMGKYLKDNETAFIVPANDIDAIAEKILFIVNNPDIATIIGQNGKNFALEKFNFLNYSDKLTSFFKSFAEK
jgi:glycosyltransferase involved in cell wall biosynthesis